MAVIELLDKESVYLEPVVAGVQLLNSRVVSLEPLPTAELQLLDSRVIILEPLVEVQLLDSRVIILEPLVVEVQLLDTRTITLSPIEEPPPPPDEEEEKKFPWLLVGIGGSVAAIGLLALAKKRGM